MSRYLFAARRPDLVIRRLRGLPALEVGLDEIATYLPEAPVILEAGACDGSDTLRLASRWPAASVHAFEPVPQAYNTVRERVGHLPHVHTYALALSDRDGLADLHVSEDVSGAGRPDSSSLLEPTLHLDSWPTIVFRQTLTVPTITLDTWAAREDIRHVDLMWLDLQGMELRVLRASRSLLQRTRVIYMEVFRQPLYAEAPVYDEVTRWMRHQGFTLAIDRVSSVAGNALFVRDP